MLLPHDPQPDEQRGIGDGVGPPSSSSLRSCRCRARTVPSTVRRATGTGTAAYDVADVAAPIVANGPAVDADLSIPGTKMLLSFGGSRATG
jgi:hypothetical protein